jgi:DNA-binding response OmpR family regulator
MGGRHRILIVDGDHDFRISLKEQLKLHEGLEVATSHTASEAMEFIKTNDVELLLFDVCLPDMDGREAVWLLRRSGFKTPIIMLTGKFSDADEILCLNSGANDYITKPFKLPILLARVRAHLRVSHTANFNIGRLTFKPASKLLLDERGRKIRLTEKETSILKYLYWAGDRVVTRETLLRELWGQSAPVATHALETHVYRLRQKIEKDPGHAQILVTATGGYRLVL